jgi:ankyrin repeat protein
VNFGADINYKRAENITALSKAKELGRKNMAKMLVLNGAHINLRDDSGDTALHVAVGESDPGLVHCLRD